MLLLTGMAAALFTALTPLGGRPGLGAYLGVVPALIAIRFAFGVSTAPLYPACAKMSSNWVPETGQARIQAAIIAGAPFGGAISPAVFSCLMAAYGWRASFGIAAAATAVLGGVWFWCVADHPRRHHIEKTARLPSDEPPVSWHQLLTNRNLILLTLAYFAAGYFNSVFFYWIYYYFGQVLKIGFAKSATYTTFVFVVVTFMMPLGGWLSDRLTKWRGPRFGRRAVPAGGFALAGLLLCVGTWAHDSLATVAMFSLSAGFVFCCEGPLWAAAIEVGGQRVGAACSILNTGGNLGSSLSPVFTPLIAAALGWSWGIYVASLTVFAGAIVVCCSDPTNSTQSRIPIPLGRGSVTHAAHGTEPR